MQDQQARRSVGMRLFYLNYGSQFETCECSCVKFLLEEFFYPSGHIRLECELTGVQCGLRIPNGLIHKKNVRHIKLNNLFNCRSEVFLK